MSPFIIIVKGDYLQRTRSYTFLITLAISLYVAYSFVPPPDANYTTVRVGNYIGDYTSAWIGHVTAIMTSVFLSLVGFFLVNNSLKKDIDTEVGMIIATTQVSNFRYLMSKVISNFLVLLTMMVSALVMSIGLFFFRSTGFDFEISGFLLPYCFVTLSSLFFIASLAVVAEVFLGRRSVIQYIAFFAFFNIVIANVQMSKATEAITWVDPFGVKVVTMGLERFVTTHLGEAARVTSMGFNFGSKDKLRVFEFTGMAWPTAFLLSRVVWLGLSVVLVYGSSLFFHRFDVREKMKTAKKVKLPAITNHHDAAKSISLTALPATVADYSIKAFIKTELLMLFRKGPRWFWLVNLGGMVALVFVPLPIAHEFLLPILWFLQVLRVSDIITKEKTNRIHHFTFAAYHPLKRLLPSQLLAGIILLVALALPLLVRHLMALQFLSALGIVAGSVFIVMLSAALGSMSGGKKLFEILFFLITYANLNRIPFANYFGWQASMLSVTIILLLSAFLFVVSLLVRSYEIRHS